MILFEEFVAIVLGGALGSVFRFMLSTAINEILPRNYPWGIWFVNIIGSLAMGVVAALFMHKYVDSVFFRTLVMIGFLGGFTTFSSYSLDTFFLFQNGEIFKACVYMVTSVVFSIAALAIGYVTTKAVLP